MTRLRLRDRVYRPSVARALTAPSGVVVGSAATAVLLAGGAPVPGAVAAGALAWLVPIVRAVFGGQAPSARPRRSTGDELPEVWAAQVNDARDAQQRYRRVVKRCSGGPLRDHLKALEDDVADSVDRCGELAQWGADATAARTELDPAAIERAARSSGRQARKAAAAQWEVKTRLDMVIDQTMARLVLINGRLDEAVGRAVEMASRIDCDEEGELDLEAAEVATELRSLQAALQEVGDLQLGGDRRRGQTPGTSAAR